MWWTLRKASPFGIDWIWLAGQMDGAPARWGSPPEGELSVDLGASWSEMARDRLAKWATMSWGEVR